MFYFLLNSLCAEVFRNLEGICSLSQIAFQEYLYRGLRLSLSAWDPLSNQPLTAEKQKQQ